jgi:hypothetical protein
MKESEEGWVGSEGVKGVLFLALPPLLAWFSLSLLGYYWT